MCSPPDHPPKIFCPLSQHGKSRGGEQSKCLCSVSANTIRTPSTNPKGCAPRNPTKTYLLRREVQREREGEIPLPSSASSSPLSPAHFSGFLVSSQSVLGSRWSTGKKTAWGNATQVSEPTRFHFNTSLIEFSFV